MTASTAVAWRVRSALTPARRTALRRATDPWVGPFGSVRGAASRDTIALTFDDGPSAWTGPILDVLERHGATATFFVLVERAEADARTIRRILAAGHEVGLHGLDHRRLTALPAGVVRAHLAAGKQRLEAVTGEPVRWFRPPYGTQTPRTFVAARRCGLDVVVWTADAEDWLDHTPDDVATLALQRVRPGGVLLLHDGFESDPAAPLPEPTFDRAAALEQFLLGLADRGARAASVGALLAGARPDRTAWFRP